MSTYDRIAAAWRSATLAIEIPPPPLCRCVRVREAVERLIAAGNKREWQGHMEIDGHYEAEQEWEAASDEARAAVQALNTSGGRI